MVPPCSDRISRVPPYSSPQSHNTRTGLSPTKARLSRRFRLIQLRHWPGPRSLATTSGVSVDVLSSGYLDVSVPRVCSLNGYSIRSGLPHSEIHGSKLIRSSPWLIAAYHVFHRLLSPRHPPNALKTLDHSHYQCSSFSRQRRKKIIFAGTTALSGYLSASHPNNLRAIRTNNVCAPTNPARAPL